MHLQATQNYLALSHRFLVFVMRELIFNSLSWEFSRRNGCSGGNCAAHQVRTQERVRKPPLRSVRCMVAWNWTFFLEVQTKEYHSSSGSTRVKSLDTAIANL